jgi:ABC-2 type transport system permease protein
MNIFRYVLIVAWKQLQLVLKDRGSLGILFLLPLLIGTVSAAPTAMMLRAESEGKAAILLNVCLVVEDTGAFGTEVAKALQEIKELKIETLSSAQEAEQRVAKGEVSAAIIIPASFTQDINTYTPTKIDVIVDPAQPESTSIVTGIMNQVVAEATIWGEVQYGIRSMMDESGLFTGASPQEQQGIQAQTLGVIMTRLNELRRNPPIAVLSEDMGAAATGRNWMELFLTYIFTGFAVMFIFFTVGASASSLLEERESGAMRRLIASPLAPVAILAGNMLAFALIACLQAVVMFGLSSMVFGISLGDSPLALLLLTIAVALTASSLGLVLASLTKTSKQAGSLGTVLGFVLAGIGGAIAVNPGMMFFRAEGLMGILARLTPHAHAMEGYYSIMAENASLASTLPQIGILLGMAVLFILIARYRFKFI